ncbi:MAG: hypothetical protein IT552_03675 [Sphingomonadaceae bacterium]|nr:hypothetical protein [Sphingomonadaceae bacterium]
MQSEPGLLIKQIASLVPQAAKSVSRFVRDMAAAILPSLVSRFMAVARRRRKADDDKGSASHSEANSKFFAASSTAKGDGVDGADFGSMFLAPPMTPRPSPRPRSARRLRARFRARHFLKPPWMR